MITVPSTYPELDKCNDAALRQIIWQLEKILLDARYILKTARFKQSISGKTNVSRRKNGKSKS